MQSTLSTDRLLLRPFVPSDAAWVQRLAGDARIAGMTTNIPHPYPDGVAEAWIAAQADDARVGRGASFAVVMRDGGEPVGAMSLLHLHAGDARAMLAYWIGVAHWGQGHATEAARRIVRHATDDLGLTRIEGRCLARNLASARVLEKAGLVREGLLRRHVRRHGAFEDMLLYGLLMPGREPGTIASTGTIGVRPARAADAAALAALLPDLGYTAAEADVARRLDRLAGRYHDDVVLVAADAGRVVGVCHVQGVPLLATDGYAEVQALVVARDRQRLGIGRRLLDAAVTWSASRGYARVRLRSGLHRDDAHRFYEAQGFTRSKASYAFERWLAPGRG